MATKKKTVRYADAYKGEIVEVEVPEKQPICLEKKEEPEPLVSTKLKTQKQTLQRRKLASPLPPRTPSR